MCRTRIRIVLSVNYTASLEIKKYNLLHVVQCFGVHECSVLFRGLCGPSRSQSEKKVDDMCRENCASKGLFI